MKTRFFAFIAATLLLANAVTFATGDTRSNRAAAKRQTSRIVGLLPASDAVVTFDAKHFFGAALPKVLSANQAMLAEVMAKLAEAEARTGIDFKKFEQVAVGVAYNRISATETDFEPVAIASGDISVGALMAVARLASKGTYTTESINGRTVYVFSVKDLVQKNAPIKPASSKVAGVVDQAMTSLTKDIAVTALDKNTLVMGTLARVKETIEGKSHLSADLTSLLPPATTVASFAARFDGGISSLLPVEADAFGLAIGSIQYVSGSFDVNAVGADLQVAARTKKAEDAQNLKDTLEGLAMLGKIALGGAKTPDKQVYARMLKNVKIAAVGTDLTVGLAVPQADIDILVGGIK
jgi:hypothetical protein